MKRDYEVEIALRVLVKDVEDEDDAIAYADDLLFALNEIAYSTDEWDDHYEIANSKILTVREV